MYKIMKLLKGKQSGQVLILALALLGVGSLMIAPMLSLMGTGLNAGKVSENKMDELYACDAGVQDAIWQINHLDEPGAIPYTELDGTDDDTGDYPIEEVYDYTTEGRTLPHINGMDVDVEITFLYLTSDGWPVYRIRTWVGGTVVDNSTMVDAIVTTTWLDFTGITNHIITSQGDYDIDTGIEVEPPDPYPDDPNGARANYDGPWPTPEDMTVYYSRDVDKDNPYPFDEIDLDGVDTELGPEYIEGEFTIRNFSSTEATLTLEGTIYITGNTVIGGNKDWTLDLNGQTIFVESDVVGGGASGTALILNSNCKLVGSGCIIAVGDIDFSPSLQTEPDEYILVLSIIGETLMHPSGDFYGTLAGKVFVDVKSGETPHIEWTEPPGDLNFPGSGGGSGMIWGIHTWSYWTIWGSL